MVSWVDILPTLIAAGGGTAPAGVDGRSFLDVLRGTTSRHRDEVFATHSGDGANNVYPMRAVRTRQFKLILNLFPKYAHTTNTDRGGGSGQGRLYYEEWVAAAARDESAARTLRRYHQRPAEEFYDVTAIPYELATWRRHPKHNASSRGCGGNSTSGWRRRATRGGVQHADPARRRWSAGGAR